MDIKLKQIAFKSGISFDSFGSPVVDKEVYLVNFAQNILDIAINIHESTDCNNFKESVKTALGMK